MCPIRHRRRCVDADHGVVALFCASICMDIRNLVTTMRGLISCVPMGGNDGTSVIYNLPSEGTGCPDIESPRQLLST